MSRTATPATAALARVGVAFTIHEYVHEPGAGGYGEEAAAALGVPPDRIYKTLIVRVDGARLVVAVLPVGGQLSMKALAAAVGGKRAELAAAPDAERSTGYVLGGISPLGQRKRLPTVMDAGATGHRTIYCSAGRRGMQVELDPAALLRLTGAVVAPLVAVAEEG